jgi:hypothetical protein
MKRLIVVALGLIAVSCGGGGSGSSIPEADWCPQASQTACGKLYNCPDGTFVLLRAYLSSTYGVSTESGCEAYGQSNCTSFGSCTAGQTYHADKAQQCKDQVNAKSCTDLAASINITSFSASASLLSTLAPACSQVCTGGADAGADAPTGG